MPHSRQGIANRKRLARASRMHRRCSQRHSEGALERNSTHITLLGYRPNPGGIYTRPTHRVPISALPQLTAGKLFLEFPQLGLLFKQHLAHCLRLRDDLFFRLLQPIPFVLLHLYVEFGGAALARLECSRGGYVEGDGSPGLLWQRRRWVGGKGTEEVLEGVVENDLVVLPGVDRPVRASDLEGRNLGLARRGPGM